MKILRLSFFNLRKNKREAAAILFLTLISSFLLCTFFSSVANIPKVFDKCFEETGCADSALRISADKYRDDFYGILADDFGIGDIRRGSMLYATGVQITRDDKTYTMNLNFVTESTERKFESFVKCSSLSESEIEKLEHPIWLTEYFMLNDGYEPGDTFTIIAGGRDYPFEIAVCLPTRATAENASCQTATICCSPPYTVRKRCWYSTAAKGSTIANTPKNAAKPPRKICRRYAGTGRKKIRWAMRQASL